MGDESEGSSGGVTVVEAATVLCVRASIPASDSRTLSSADYVGARALTQEATKWIGTDFELQFSSGLQVLMGQSEVVNWPRSTSPHQLTFMRYGGEFKFAGGSRDLCETLEQTARRELQEEFVTQVPPSAVLRPFRVNSTKALAGKAFIMYNYVAIAEENPWLDQLDVGQVNAALAARRSHFESLARADGPFWSMSRRERELVSPEVHQLQWMDISEAVDVMLTSKCVDLVPVNSYQELQFSRFGITRRDPMFASMFTLQALEQCQSIEGVKQASSSHFDAQLSSKAAKEASKRRNETWLESTVGKKLPARL